MSDWSTGCTVVICAVLTTGPCVPGVWSRNFAITVTVPPPPEAKSPSVTVSGVTPPAPLFDDHGSTTPSVDVTDVTSNSAGTASVTRAPVHTVTEQPKTRRNVTDSPAPTTASSPCGPVDAWAVLLRVGTCTVVFAVAGAAMAPRVNAVRHTTSADAIAARSRRPAEVTTRALGRWRR